MLGCCRQCGAQKTQAHSSRMSLVRQVLCEAILSASSHASSHPLVQYLVPDPAWTTQMNCHCEREMTGGGVGGRWGVT